MYFLIPQRRNAKKNNGENENGKPRRQLSVRFVSFKMEIESWQGRA